jgi:hypothetical protein
MKAKIGYLNSLLFVAVAVLGTTTIAASSSTSQVWADVFEGTEGPDFIIGTPGDDVIDSKGGDDRNYGDTSFFGDGSGDDIINSGEESDVNLGDTVDGTGSGDDVIVSGDGGGTNRGDTAEGEGSGDDVIVSGEGEDFNTGNGGRDIFICGGEADTVTDYNEAEGDIATPDCEDL